MGVKVMVLGSGGREHAIAWKMAQSVAVAEVYCVPGNPGTAEEIKVRNLALKPTDADQVVAAAHALDIALVVIGPEAPLVVGVGDALRRAGIPVFGPNAAGAMLEESKAYAKAFMERHGIPTARYGRFTDRGPALDYLRDHPLPVVVKADGLAAGKGVVVALEHAEAEAAVHRFLQWGPIVIEEFLEGEEASFIAIVVDGQVLPLAGSQDHKRLLDDDQGPNTGGMGAYSPTPILDTAMSERVLREVMCPAAQGLVTDRTPYCGFLYAGLMITRDGPKVIEFNVRFGDPETQVLMPRIGGDFAGLLKSCADGTIDLSLAHVNPEPCVGVVLASSKYPTESTPVADLPADLRLPEGVRAFWGSSQLGDGKVSSPGGRVLTVAAVAATLHDARARAYEGVRSLRERFGDADLTFRSDIALF